MQENEKKRKIIENDLIVKKIKYERQSSNSIIYKINDHILEPIEYPFNKDGYRYILAEPDPTAPFASQFHSEDSSWLAGRPIPPFLYRMYQPNSVTLSLNDRAHQLKVNDSKCLVSGEKGYSLIRATHGINYGTWYFECKINDMSENSATRIGWGQQFANLQAPLGYDKFGYSWQSKRGSLFHQSKGIHFNKDESSYQAGDTLGFFIHLPSIKHEKYTKYLRDNKIVSDIPGGIQFYNQYVTKNKTNNYSKIQPWKDYLPLIDESCKYNPLVKFKGCFYFEQKENVEVQNKRLKTLPGSMIAFYKNGKLVYKKSIYEDYKYLKKGQSKDLFTGDNSSDDPAAFKDIYFGTYFPAISLYFNSTVIFNPGPNFEYPPTKFPRDLTPQPISDLVYELASQQILNDLVYFIINKDRLTI